MAAIGILNVTLAACGLWLLISSGWQLTETKRDARIKNATICWLVAATIGFCVWAVKG